MLPAPPGSRAQRVYFSRCTSNVAGTIRRSFSSALSISTVYTTVPLHALFSTLTLLYANLIDVLIVQVESRV